MFWLFMRVSGWLGLIPLALGAAIVFVGSQISENAVRLDAEGLEAVATVIDKRQYARSSGTGTATTTYYNLRYHFPIGGGALHYGNRDVSRDFYQSVEVGSAIPIRYLPSDPDLHEIEAGAVGNNALYATLFGSVLAVCGLLLLWLQVRTVTRMATVRDRGARADATVEAVQLTPGANRIAFRYPDSQGVDRTGHSIAGRRWRVRGVEPGDLVPIRYDPQRPQRAYTEADLGIEAAALEQRSDQISV